MSKRPHRIAFSGKARSGKDEAITLLSSLIKADDRDAIIRKPRFAEPVYDIAALIQRYLAKPVVKDPKLLIHVGVGLREVYTPDIWMERVRQQIDTYADTDHVFVADLRFRNEHAMLRAAGFTVVRINRPNRPIDRNPNDISECDLDDAEFDYNIHNNGTIEEYHQKLAALYRELKNI